METIYCANLNMTLYQMCLDEEYINKRFNTLFTTRVILPCSPFEKTTKRKGKESLKEITYIKAWLTCEIVYDAINDVLAKIIITHGDIPDLQLNELIKNLKLKKLDEFCQENYK
jgi:hypothetical protein